MANWKVIADRIEIMPHPNADALALGKVGPFQLVVAKTNGYQSGDIVVFAPERSVLPDDLKGDYINSETGLSYLSGPDHNRVKRVRLRGEYSEGVTINPAYVEEKLGSSLDGIPLDEDLSERLGIVKYEPPIPTSMAGEIVPVDVAGPWREHDVEQFRLYASDFRVGEAVIVTEKIHGSQIVLFRSENGTSYVTSKGFAHRGQAILENETNIYWRAVRATGLFDLIAATPQLRDHDVQVFGEVFPCQGANFAYGQAAPTLRLFRVFIDGMELTTAQVAEVTPEIMVLWVPILYRGPYDEETLVALAAGREQVSGKETNIREGIVAAPVIPRASSEGFPLYLKIINPKYKDSDEFVS